MPSSTSTGGPPAKQERAISLLMTSQFYMAAQDLITGRREDSAGQRWVYWVGEYMKFAEHTTPCGQMGKG